MNMLTQFDIFEMIKSGDIAVDEFTEWLGNERMEAYNKGIQTEINVELDDEIYNIKMRG